MYKKVKIIIYEKNIQLMKLRTFYSFFKNNFP